MYAKADTLLPLLNTPCAEKMADILQHIGSEQLANADHPMALKWLRRAQALINKQDLEQLSTEGLDLRLSICHDLIQTLLVLGSAETVQEADDLVSYLESEIGDKPIILHWKLEVLQKSPGEVFDASAYTSIIRRMIRSLDMSNASVGFILHNIKGLWDRSYRLALGLLDEVLLTRLIPHGSLEWIGKALVRRVWMSTMDENASDAATDLENLLGRVPQDFGALPASVASQSVCHSPPRDHSANQTSSYGKKLTLYMQRINMQQSRPGVRSRCTLCFPTVVMPARPSSDGNLSSAR